MAPREVTKSIQQKVLKTYCDNMESLSKAKQFHFNSRLFLWTQESCYEKRLISLKDFFLENIEEILENVKNPVAEHSRRFLHQRQFALEKYPWITQYNALLFKWLFLKTIFRVDIRERVLLAIPKDILQFYAKTLLNDPHSLIALSTLGINFLYLTRGILQDSTLFHPENLLHIAEKHYPDTNEYAELSLYYFTHCIIGESEFYNKKPLQENTDIYQSMIYLCEEILEKHFPIISLDNKVEFLVAAKLCQTQSALLKAIQEECVENFSKKLGYIRDSRRATKTESLSSEEHRNVLYIMSNLEFTAHSS